MDVPPNRSESYGNIAILCGVAPLPLALMGFLPFAGCLTTPLSLLAIVAAVGFGLAGVLQPPSSTERSSPRAWIGLLLGIAWVGLLVAGTVMLVRSGELHGLLNMRGH